MSNRKHSFSRTSHHTENDYSFDVIFKLYYPKVKNFVYGFVGVESEAEDIAQDIFLKLWTKRNNIQIMTNFEAYLYTMARNCTLNALKSSSVRHKLQSLTDADVVADTGVEDIIYSEELHELINRVTSQMPDQRRRIFTMSRLDGMSNEEIGHRLNISKRTVETHISQALAQIRRLLVCFILFHYL